MHAELAALFREARDGGVEIKARRRKLRKHRDVMVGSDLVDFIVLRQNVPRAYAIELCQKVRARGSFLYMSIGVAGCKFATSF